MSRYRLFPLLLALLHLGCGDGADAPRISTPELGSLRSEAAAQVRDLIEKLEAAAPLVEEELLPLGFVPACGDDLRCGLPALFERVDALGSFLVERALLEENFVEAQGQTLLYRPSPETSCDPGDRRCAELLDRLDLLLRVQPIPEEGGLILSAQSGRRMPLLLRLFEGELAVELNLLELEAVLESLLEVDGAALGLLEGVELLQGRVELSITALDQGRVSIQLSVLEPVEVASREQKGSSLFVDAAVPAAHLHLDPLLDLVELEASVGNVEIRGPISSFYQGSEPLGGRLAIFLEGLQGKASWLADAASRFLTVDGFGLGDETSRITLDGAPLLSVDLNRERGRRIDLQLSEDLELGLVLQLGSALELDLGIQFANLADQLEIPHWALDESYHLLIDGAPSPALLFREGSGREEAGRFRQLEVLAGRLLIQARSSQEVRASRRILVEEGMCLLPSSRAAKEARVAKEEEEEEAHLLDTFEAGVCH